MARDFIQLWVLFNAMEKKPLTFGLEFSMHILISLAAKEWKTCLVLSLNTFTLCGFRSLVSPENTPFVIGVFFCHLEEVSVDADVKLCKFKQLDLRYHQKE